MPRSLVDEEMKEKLRAIPKEHQPCTPKGPDPKWRYMWRVGPRPLNTRFQVFYLSILLQKSLNMKVYYIFTIFSFLPLQELNSEPVIPAGFPEWKETMDSWGYKMISAIEVC